MTLPHKIGKIRLGLTYLNVIKNKDAFRNI